MTGRICCMAIVAAMLAAGAAHSQSAETLDDGQRAFDAGNYADAGRIWQNLAGQGNASAMWRLGMMYDLGRGVAQDQTIAFRDYLIAAQAGLPEAEFNVAVMYDSGVGVPKNADLAALWYARAASRGFPRAEYNLGQLYAAGDGVPRNPELARAWYHAAAGAGLQAATERLAALPSSDAPSTATDAVSHTVLAPVLLSAPVGGETVVTHNDATEVELVWVAPEQPAPARFYVQVMGNKNGQAQERFAAYTDTSAMLVKLPPEPGDYAWRVYAVGAGIDSYAASDWSRFTVAAADAAHPVARPLIP